ncbi:hypothetical protein D3C81_1348550 [compost metagenome]
MALFVSGGRILLLLKGCHAVQRKRTVDSQHHMQTVVGRLTVLLCKFQQTFRGAGAINGDQDGAEHAGLHEDKVEPLIVGQRSAQIKGLPCTV